MSLANVQAFWQRLSIDPVVRAQFESRHNISWAIDGAAISAAAVEVGALNGYVFTREEHDRIVEVVRQKWAANAGKAANVGTWVAGMSLLYITVDLFVHIAIGAGIGWWLFVE